MGEEELAISHSLLCYDDDGKLECVCGLEEERELEDLRDLDEYR